MVWRGDRSGNTEQVESDVDQEPFYPDDGPDEYAERSIFATGWFRAILVLAALAIAVVAMLPYLLDWFEPVSSPVKPPVQARSAMPSTPPSPSQPTASPALEQAPSAPEVRRTPATPVRPSAPTLAAPAAQEAPRALPTVRAGTVERRQPREEALSKRNGDYWVQLGVFKDSGNAERLAKKLRGEGYSVQVATVTRIEDGLPARGASGRTGATYYLVRAGAFLERTRAIAARDDLKARGHIGFLTEGAAR